MSNPIGQTIPPPDAASTGRDADCASPDEAGGSPVGASGDASPAEPQDLHANDPDARDRPHRPFAYAADASALAASDSQPQAPELLFGAYDDAGIAAPQIVSGAALLAPPDAAPVLAPSSGSDLIVPDIVFQTDPVSDLADVVVDGVSATNSYGVTGAGISVGIISDSFNANRGAAAAEADGALPPAADVHILQDASSGTDEGQAMAEIVHSIAPNAQIYFYTAGDTDADMAQAIEALQAAGCQIIVDDVAYLDEPVFEEGGVISQAVNQVVADGSTYFTAANNFGQSYYQGSFTPVLNGTTTYEDFNVAGAPHAYLEPITIPKGATVVIDLQWAQPFKTGDGAADGSGSNYSLAFRLLNSSLGAVDTGTALDKNGDPVQYGEFTNESNSTTFYLEVYENQTGTVSPGEFKIVAEDDSFSPVVFDDPNAGIGSGTVFGHEEDPTAITVGAVPESEPSTLEPFSGSGPGEFYYNSSGILLPSPVYAGKVDLVAPDGNSTTIFNPFYGTSAAAPAAAAVGALVLQANGALDPADIEDILEDSASPTVTGTGSQTGSGLVDAYLAVGEAETLTFSETASTGTLLGTHLNDTFVGGPGNHTINGEGGINTLNYNASPAAVSVNFATGTATNGYGGTDTFSNIQIVDGSAFDDAFVSGAAGETIYGGGATDSLDFSDLAAGGLVALDSGTFNADQGSDSGSNAGTIDVANGSSLEIFGTLANAGSLVANDADLDVTGALTGAGTALVENGGIVELGGSDAAGVAFGGTASTLKLASPTSFAGDMISGLILGDVLDLADTSVASATIVGSSLSIVESGGTNFSYAVSGALAGDHFGMAGDGSTGTDLILESGSGISFAPAQAMLDTSSPLSLGNARVGGTLSHALSITNSAAPPAESLDVSLGVTTGDATATGAISLLAAGATNSSGIVVGLGTASAGAQAGTVGLDYFSDGAGTDGKGTTSIGTGSVTVTGAVYREATASASAPSTPLVFHVGGSGAVPITVANTAANDGYSEALIASVGTTSGVSASGTTGDIAAQGSSSAISATVSTASAGTIAGSVTLNLQSDGTGIDGFGPTADGTATVAINATVDNYAVAALEETSGGGTWSQSGTSYTLSLGSIAQGAAPVTVGLGVLNNVTGPADLLSGSFITSGGSAFTLAGFGTFSALGAGAADTQPSVTLSASTAGTFTETITLDPTGSNASGYSGALPDETLTITGTVFAPAQAMLDTSSPLSLGNARVGGTLSHALSITNSAAPPAESLDVSLGATTSDATATGAISLLAAGATNSSGIVVGLGTASAGAQAGTVGLDYFSDGAGTDGKGTTSIGTGSVTVTGAVYREATASASAPSTPLVFHVGGSGAVPITVANTAANDGYSEALIASVGTTSGVSANGTTGDIAAQGSSSAISATVSTASAGTIAGSVTLNLQSDGTGIDGFGPTADGTATVAINATVDNYAVAALEETSGGGTWSQSGNDYTLSLGSIAQGAAPVTVGLGVLNNVTGPADLLSGSFTTSGGSAFTLAGFGTFSALGAGAADTQPSVTLSASTAGTFTETITLDPTGSNASGYSGALPAETLTITGTVVAPASSATWNGPSASNRSGSFNTAADWSTALVPTSATKAVISNSGTYTVTSGQNNSVAALTLSDTTATLAVSGGTFAILGSSTNSGQITVADAASLELTGTMTNSGGFALGSTGDATDLIIAGSATLKGAGQIDLSDNTDNAIISNGAAATLTNSSTIAGSGTIGDAFLTVVNSTGDVIDATGVANALTLTGAGGIKNTGGLIEATGSAGLVIANTTVTAGTIAASGGNVEFVGATMLGGTLASSAGNVIATEGTADVVSGTTSTGNVSVSDGTDLTLKGTITNSGGIALDSTGDATDLVISVNATLKGAGQLDLSDNADNAIISNGAAATFNNTSTIAGSGTIGDAFLTVVNSTGGVIDATGTANALTLTGTGGIKNTGGLIEATGSAGLVIANTTVTAGTVAASGGNVELVGATALGSTLESSTGSIIAIEGAADTLSGTTSSGTLSVGDGTDLTLKGTITDSGSIALNSTGDATELTIAGIVALEGAGAVTMSNSADNAIGSNGTAATLDNSAAIAGAGNIGDSFLTLNNEAGGTIDASDGDALAIATGSHTVTNSGLIEATGAGGLTISNLLTNNGILAASGGNLTVSNQVSGTGTAAIANGTLTFDNKVAATQAVSFAADTTGTLALGLAQSFAGTVAGFTGNDAIDLANFAFSGAPSIGSVSAIALAGGSGVAVTVNDGSLSATIDLLNQASITYSTSASAYVLASDESGAHPGTLLQLATPAA